MFIFKLHVNLCHVVIHVHFNIRIFVYPSLTINTCIFGLCFYDVIYLAPKKGYPKRPNKRFITLHERLTLALLIEKQHSYILAFAFNYCSSAIHFCGVCIPHVKSISLISYKMQLLHVLHLEFAR